MSNTLSQEMREAGGIAAVHDANGLITSAMTTQLNGITFNATKNITITTAEINNLCV